MRAAAVQLNATGDRATNLERADRLTRAAAAAGATLVVLPEKWSLIGSARELREGAEPLDGPAIGWARELARELSLDLVAGSIVERLEGETGLANTCVHVGRHGEIRAVYRKIHMFDVEVDGTTHRESEVTKAGDQVAISVDDAGVRLGLSICYDVRFPEPYRVMAAAGARVITLPAAFTLATTRDHWSTLVRARAVENQAFVVAANQIGPHPGGMRSGGRSMIVDPWGVVLAQAPDAEGHVLAELDLASQDSVRRSFPALAHRRPDVYARSPHQAGGEFERGAESADADVGELAASSLTAGMRR